MVDRLKTESQQKTANKTPSLSKDCGSTPAWNVKAHLVSEPHQFQLIAHCHCCNEAFHSGVFAHVNLSPEQLEDLDYTQQECWEEFIHSKFRYCKACAKWVCRESCWEPIRLKCERCTNPGFHQHNQSQSGDQESVYSSILGGICQHCNMVLPSQAKACPECGEKTTQ